jgi:hypothetical protein
MRVLTTTAGFCVTFGWKALLAMIQLNTALPLQLVKFEDCIMKNFNEVGTVVIINFILTYYLAVCFEYLENVGRTNPRLRIVLVHISL